MLCKRDLHRDSIVATSLKNRTTSGAPIKFDTINTEVKGVLWDGLHCTRLLVCLPSCVWNSGFGAWVFANNKQSILCFAFTAWSQVQLHQVTFCCTLVSGNKKINVSERGIRARPTASHKLGFQARYKLRPEHFSKKWKAAVFFKTLQLAVFRWW